MKWIKENWIAIVTGVMLLLAIPSIWPYAYYQLLRWVVTGAAGYIAFKKYEIGSKKWMWVMIAVAILFNPIAPFHLDKEIWAILDLVTAIVFFMSTVQKKKSIKEESLSGMGEVAELN